jgi:hypothetical protein
LILPNCYENKALNTDVFFIDEIEKNLQSLEAFSWKKRRSCSMFQALEKISPFSFDSLQVLGFNTSTMMYGPSHGGVSLCHPLVFWLRRSTRSPTLRSRLRMCLSW